MYIYIPESGDGVTNGPLHDIAITNIVWQVWQSYVLNRYSRIPVAQP